MAERRFMLILGGARSGKSRHAEELIARHPPPWIYVATAEALDGEMDTRIAQHRARRGDGWRTLEAPLRLAEAVGEADAGAPLLIDCLTLWATNHLLAGSDMEAEAGRLAAAIARRPGLTIAVANEVGLGIVPDNALARQFRDVAGRLNQRLAACADDVLFMVAGLPMVVKQAPAARPAAATDTKEDQP